MKTNKILLGILLFLAMISVANAVTLDINGTSVIEDEGQTVTIDLNALTTYNGTDILIFDDDVDFGQIVAGVFTWVTDFDDAGSYPVNFMVTDGTIGNSETSLITVLNVNRAPSITSTAVDEVEVDDNYYYNVDATDPDGDTLTYTLITGPVGMTIDSDDGELRWSPNASNIDGNSVQVEVSDGSLKDSQSFSIDVVALELDRLEVFVEDNDERLDDRDTFDAEPGDSLSFEFTIRNLFSGDTDDEEIDIEDVEITINIDEWEDNRDEDWDSDRFDIDYDDKETITIDLGRIPIDIDDGKQTVTIEIEGEDEEGNRHEITWTVFMDIDKKREDIRISSVSLEPSTVSCNRNPLLVVRLVNAGSKDSDEIVFEAKQSVLGISIQDYGIDLDEGDSETIENLLHIMSDIAPGTYYIRVSSYFDLNDFDDQDVTDSENVQLTVQNCAVTEPEEEEEEEPDEVIVITPDQGVTIPVVPEEKPLFSVDNAYLVGLILVNVLLILGIIWVLVKLLAR